MTFTRLAEIGKKYGTDKVFNVSLTSIIRKA